MWSLMMISDMPSKHVGAVKSVLKKLFKINDIQLVHLERYAGLQSSIPLHTERTHTHQILCCHITTIENLHSYHIFKFSDFNKEHTSSLKMI